MGALFFCVRPAFCTMDKATQAIADSVDTRESYISSDTQTAKDTVIIDGTSMIELTEEELNMSLKKHSPHKATIFSAVLPGLGQIYNRKYWKVPIIYLAGYGFYSGFGLGWGWKYYDDIYQEYRLIYQEEFNKGAEGDSQLIETSQRIMSTARERRDKIVIWMGILYFANVVDAMVDAYFYYYDISDDLSMRITPGILTTDQYAAQRDYSYGFKLSLKF